MSVELQVIELRESGEHLFLYFLEDLAYLASWASTHPVWFSRNELRTVLKRVLDKHKSC